MVQPILQFDGLASGIQSSAYINAIIDRERVGRITPLENKITSLKDTNDAFGQLSTLLNKLKTSAENFRAVNGGVLVKRGTSSDETVISASTTSFAQNGTYSLTVNGLAKNATMTLGSTGTTYTSADQAINSNINDGDPNRTVSVAIGTGSEQETVNIDLTSSTTLNDFVTQFNGSTSKAVASVVNVGSTTSPNYKVLISSNNTGLSEGQITVDVGSEITDPDGIPGTINGAFDSNELSQATDASLTIDGIGTITRSNNKISDIFTGVTFDLKDLGTSKIAISDDSAGSAQRIQEFVSAYNEVVKYIKEKDLVTQEGTGNNIINVFGALSSTSLDESVTSSLRSALTSSSKSGGLVNTLSDLGVTTQRDGTLKFDSSVFQTAISNEPTSVRTITEALGESLASTTGAIAQYTRFQGLFDVAIQNNKGQITKLQDQISTIEKNLEKQTEVLNQRFSNLEAQMSKLQSQQNTLSSILPK